MVHLIHLSVTLYSLTLPIPLPKLIDVPELKRVLITRLCQNVLSVCPEKCIFASAMAPIPIYTTNEEGRILDCPVHSNISCLLSPTSLTPLQESEKNGHLVSEQGKNGLSCAIWVLPSVALEAGM